MKSRNIAAALITFVTLALGLTSCFDDDESTTVVTINDIATIMSYGSNTVNFQIIDVRGKAYNLFADINAKINQQKFPAGSHALITYNMNATQNTDVPFKVDLLSIRKAETIGYSDAQNSECKLDYKNFGVDRIYLAGDYINLIANVERDADRTWTCLLDTDNSNGDVAHLYLLTSAPKPEYTGTTAVVCVDVSPIIANAAYKEIHLHLNNKQSNNYIYKFQKNNGK